MRETGTNRCGLDSLTYIPARQHRPMFSIEQRNGRSSALVEYGTLEFREENLCACRPLVLGAAWDEHSIGRICAVQPFVGNRRPAPRNLARGSVRRHPAASRFAVAPPAQSL